MTGPALASASVLAGTGTVTAVGSAVVVAPGDPPAGLMAVLAPPGRHSGWGVRASSPPAITADRLAAAVAGAGPVGVAVGVAGGGWAVAVGAGLRAEVDRIGYRTTHHGPWSGDVREVTAVALAAPGVAITDAAASPLPPGARTGGGVVVRGEAVLGVPPPSLEGVMCTCGAFVHPLTLRCRACQQPFHLVRRRVAARPLPVGRLVLDDGRSLPLAGTVVVGREPGVDAAVAAGSAEGLALPDSERSVSRVHAVLRLDGWDVLLEDREAVNGTAVRPPSAGEWTVLLPGSTVRLLPGTEVQMGRRTLRLAS